MVHQATKRKIGMIKTVANDIRGTTFNAEVRVDDSGLIELKFVDGPYESIPGSIGFTHAQYVEADAKTVGAREANNRQEARTGTSSVTVGKSGVMISIVNPRDLRGVPLFTVTVSRNELHRLISRNAKPKRGVPSHVSVSEGRIARAFGINTRRPRRHDAA